MDNQETIDFAKKYLEDILSFFGENIEVESSVEEDIISLDVPNSDLNSILIGRNGENLRSLQYIVGAALRNSEGAYSRVNVDIADYKKQRAEQIAEKAKTWIDEVIATGEPYVAQINAADRRIVHHVASEADGVETHSEGEGRDRRIVITKAE